MKDQASGYLLDTCVIVDLLRGRTRAKQSIKKLGWENCSVSEITCVELIYGALK